MQKYEIMYLLNPELADKPLEEAAKKVNSLIEKNDGKIEKQDIWGVKTLNYPIKGNQTANYVVTIFEIPAEKMKTLDKKLRLEESVIRFLVSLYDEKHAFTPPTPEELAAKQEEREKMRLAKRQEQEREKAQQEPVIKAEPKSKPKPKAAEAKTEEAAKEPAEKAGPEAKPKETPAGSTPVEPAPGEPAPSKEPAPGESHPARKPKKDKVSTVKTDLEDLDKKLDEILEEKDL